MKYRIVGADGKIYGPVELPQLRQWLADGRAENRTPVHVEGASDWTVLGLLPELAADFAAPPAIGALPAAAPQGANKFATAGLICSLLSWVCCCCVPLNLLGMIFSIIALVQIHSQPKPQEGRIFAILGLVLSAASLLAALAVGLLQLVMAPATAFDWQGQF